ncbi:unnamed protein product [Rotaria sp. Silwood1]|nr:unnamed protein product [Rotaria sp. Silwood1]CAF0896617.1 unnamed protein product [Rotaria sp. Silwood1]CAF0910490.1 unnamed protein product [Rotaria sp. Silwood1]CAF3352730.1 unnamed protein product [Rotaria sp. Silwood1]CAF3376077.1 unnamed protein product [Rotaria sp. Silwood1]
MIVAILVSFVHCATLPSTDNVNPIQNIESFDQLIKDYYGCDAVIQSCGNKGGCCDVHDACYKRHGCTASSWFLLWGNCAACNRDVMGCVAFRNPGKSSCCSAGNCGQTRP